MQQISEKKYSECPNCKFEALKTKPHVDIEDKMKTKNAKEPMSE